MMMRIMMRILMLVASVGCGATQPTENPDGEPGTEDGDEPNIDSGDGSPDAPSAMDSYRSGSRIKMKVATGSDGSRTFQSNYDAQRREECTFVLANDGVTRCLPLSRTAIFLGFADSACTTRVASWTSSSTELCPPLYISEFQPSASSCPPQTKLGRIYPASKLTAPTTLHVRDASGACVTVGPIQHAYVISGPEIEPASFQAGSIDIE